MTGYATADDGIVRPVAIARIERDGGTQDPSRAAESADRVELLTEIAKRHGFEVLERTPPVVFSDGERFWLADGFHRLEVAAKLKRVEMLCEVRPGTLRDAQFFAWTAANREHGKPDSAETKRWKIANLLADPEWSQMSNRAIAEEVGCHEWSVRQSRKKAGETDEARQGRDGKWYPGGGVTDCISGAGGPAPEIKVGPHPEPGVCSEADLDEIFGPADSYATPEDDQAEPEDDADDDQGDQNEPGDQPQGEGITTGEARVRPAMTATAEAIKALTAAIAAVRAIDSTCARNRMGVPTIVSDLAGIRIQIRDAAPAKPLALCDDCAGDGCQACYFGGYVSKGDRDRQADRDKRDAKTLRTGGRRRKGGR